MAEAVAHEHPDVNRGWLRPAVFGAMDGLVSNVALITGMVGGTRGGAPDAVLLAGLAGLTAGAFSMAVGEYTSVASQSEFAAAQVAKERAEIVGNPGGETAELAAMWVDRGISPETARTMAEQVHRDVDRAVAVHSMEEFGVDPADLASPWVAALSSFGSFAAGAAVPLAPFLLGVTEVWPALLLTLGALFACGAVVAQVTVRSWWWSGLRQMTLGGAAAGVTYLLGTLIGAGIG